MVTTQHSNTVAFPVEKTQPGGNRRIAVEDTTSLRLHLSSTLQTTLDLTQILRLFFEEARQHLNLGSLSYQFDKFPDEFLLGRRCRHSAHYRLITSQDSLGELGVTRRKPFSDDELRLLELLIGCLICPLRNALMYREAVQSALKDPLTGVGNRLAMENTLEREIAIAHRHQHNLSLVIVDIDHFKQINDQHGHSAGDYVLRNVAQQLLNSCRDSDATYHSYRFGGEEFVLLLNHTNLHGAKVAAERIRHCLGEMSTTFEGDTIAITASIGVASLAEADTAETLFQRADEALYIAKRDGRNRVVASRAPKLTDSRSLRG